ncbi:uncharacterized protein LOC144019229 [Festucalex cinctus]
MLGGLHLRNDSDTYLSRLLSAFKMVHCCCIVGCSNEAKGENGRSFFRIPKIIRNQGLETEECGLRREVVTLGSCVQRSLCERSPCARFSVQSSRLGSNIKVGSQVTSMSQPSRCQDMNVHRRDKQRKDDSKWQRVCCSYAASWLQLPVPSSTADIIDSGISCHTDLIANDMMETKASIKALEEDNMRLFVWR